VLESNYTTNTVLHFQLEPVNAIALQKDGLWEVHTGNQWQSLIMPTLAQSVVQITGTMLAHIVCGQ